MDYRLPDGSVGVEVKRITDSIYNELTNAFGRGDHLDSSVLAGRWTVMIDRPTLSTSLEPVPRFPDDDDATISELEAVGMTVQRKAEREAEWRATHPGPRRLSPRLARLGPDLESHLAVFENYGIRSTRGLYPYGQPEDLAAAVVAISRRTCGAIRHRHEPSSGQSPGVDIALASGYVRTGRADTMVGRIQLWLESDLSKNLRHSLANEPPGAERHAVLCFDASTEPEFIAASEQGTDFCPTADLQLPPEIHVLWFLLGPVACRYTPGAGWRSYDSPPAGGVGP